MANYYCTLKPLSHKTVKNLTPLNIKCVLHLVDYEEYRPLPSYRNSGFEKLHNHWLISISNFCEVSYLNLAETWYTKNSFNERISRYIKPHDAAKLFRRLKADFYRRMSADFLNYLYGCMERYPQCHRQVRRFLCFFRMAAKKFDLVLGKRLFHSILEIVHSNHKNTDLVLDLLMICHGSNEVQSEFINWRIDVKYLEYIIEKCYEARFDIHRYLMVMTEENSIREFPFCPVVDAILEGKSTFLKTFLRYGFQREEFEDRLWYCRYFKRIADLNFVLRTNISLFRRDRVHRFSNRRRYLLIEMLVIIFFYSWVPYSILKDNWLNCGVWLYTSIPDPFITRKEIATLLYQHKVSTGQKDIILSTCETAFSEVISEVYEPRSLKHLCRCTIRLALRNNFQLPAGIDKLKIPINSSFYALPPRTSKYLGMYDL